MPTILTIAPITNNNIMYLENDINTLHINMIVNAVLSFLFKKSNILFSFLLECLACNIPIKIIISGTIILQIKTNIFIKPPC